MTHGGEAFLARVALRVPDMDRARTLFVDLLGGNPSAGATTWLDLQYPGRGTLRLLASDRSRAALDHLLVGTDDLGHVARRLTAAGLPHRHTPDGLEVLEATSGGRTLVAELAPPPGPVPTTGSTAVGTAAVERFDHVCLATTTLQDTVALYRTGLEGDMVFGGANPVMGTTSSQIRLRSGPRIELLQPRRADAPIAGFLERHGPGLHHLTFYVADVLLAAQAARSAGFETTGTDVTSRRHWQETYLRPRTTCGLLVQLAWTDIEHTRPLTDDGVRAIHAGEVESFDNRMLPHPS